MRLRKSRPNIQRPGRLTFVNLRRPVYVPAARTRRLGCVTTRPAQFLTNRAMVRLVAKMSMPKFSEDGPGSWFGYVLRFSLFGGFKRSCQIRL
ncbi:MAG: hypothetical protein ACI8PT_004966 [Gammaproteobacteria bacterium]|jgi:hypothetical protein